MKALIFSFLLLGTTSTVYAEEVTFALSAKVASVFSLGGVTDAQSAFASGDQMEILLTYDVDTPGTQVNVFDTIYYGAIVEWSIAYDNGFSLIANDGYIKVTDGYPSWDSISLESKDQAGVDEIDAPTVGDAKLVDVAAALIDTSKTVLSSQALIPLPPRSAFTGGYVNLVFLPADGSGGRVTYVNGRITSVDQVPTRPTYSCEGFRDPMDVHPVTLKKLKRALPLKASLFDAEGNGIGLADVSARPVVRISYLPLSGLDPIDVTTQTEYAGQGEEGASFSFEDDEWKYNLKGGTLTMAGTYVISMMSPDQNEYVIEPECVTSAVIGQ